MCFLGGFWYKYGFVVDLPGLLVEGMSGDVSNYCKTCDTCQRVNNRVGKICAELHPLPVHAVWKQVGIDLIGAVLTVVICKCSVYCAYLCVNRTPARNTQGT